MRARTLAVVLATLVGVLAAVGLVETGSPTMSAAATVAPHQRPNILVVFTDDMRADEMRYMPRTRRLIGRAGMTYRNALSENPLCCPFRATLLTGQYTHNNNVLGNTPEGHGGFPAFDQQHNLNVTLHENGYHTGYFGKYLNRYPGDYPARYVPPGWSEWHVPVRQHYNYRRVVMNHNGHVRRHTGYKTDFYGRMSSAMIARLARKRAPFFAAVSYLAPHVGVTPGHGWGPATPAPRHRGSLRGRVHGPTGAFNERNMKDKPTYLRSRPDLSGRTTRRHARYVRRVRAESLISVDQAIARNIRALRRTGELRNTIVVFASDNGLLLGEHRLVNQKRVPYEESIRIPLMIRGPGFPAGTVNRGLVGAVDVATTFAHAARVVRDLPYQPDGRDLRGKRGFAARPILLETGPTLVRDTGADRRAYVGVRTRRYMYAKYWNDDEELYDLRKDRQQRTSLHDDPGYSAVLARLRAATERLKDCVGAACRR